MERNRNKRIKNLIIENTVMGNIVIEENPKPKLKKLKQKFYFSEEEDTKILKDYIIIF